jgi:hypothetical protein
MISTAGFGKRTRFIFDQNRMNSRPCQLSEQQQQIRSEMGGTRSFCLSVYGKRIPAKPVSNLAII